MRTWAFLLSLAAVACSTPEIGSYSSDDGDSALHEVNGAEDDAQDPESSTPTPSPSQAPVPGTASDTGTPTNTANTGSTQNQNTGTTPQPVTSVNVSWVAISDQTTYSLDVQANGNWTAPCIGTAILRNSLSVTFNGSCPSANNTSVSLQAVTAFRLCWAINEDWARANCLTHPYGGQSSITIKP